MIKSMMLLAAMAGAGQGGMLRRPPPVTLTLPATKPDAPTQPGVPMLECKGPSAIDARKYYEVNEVHQQLQAHSQVLIQEALYVPSGCRRLDTSKNEVNIQIFTQGRMQGIVTHLSDGRVRVDSPLLDPGMDAAPWCFRLKLIAPTGTVATAKDAVRLPC